MHWLQANPGGVSHILQKRPWRRQGWSRRSWMQEEDRSYLWCQWLWWLRSRQKWSCCSKGTQRRFHVWKVFALCRPGNWQALLEAEQPRGVAIPDCKIGKGLQDCPRRYRLVSGQHEAVSQLGQPVRDFYDEEHHDPGGWQASLAGRTCHPDRSIGGLWQDWLLPAICPNCVRSWQSSGEECSYGCRIPDVVAPKLGLVAFVLGLQC